MIHIYIADTYICKFYLCGIEGMRIETRREREIRRRREKRSTIITMIIAFVVVACVGAVLYMGMQSIEAKNNDYVAKKEELQQKVDEEKARSEELDEYAKYVKTKKFVEEVAKNKFGLIYPDEIVFKANNK